jgi:hypothetical protein
MHTSDAPQALELTRNQVLRRANELNADVKGTAAQPHGECQLSGVKTRLLDYPLQQLQPHPSYARHKLSVRPSQIAALEGQGELAFQHPIIVTGERFIIDGYARWELAKRQGRAILGCLEYEVNEDDALHLLIQTHRRAHSLNDFIRIELALDLETYFKDRALLNRQEGGRLKALSMLTQADKVNSRLEIARVAHVSVGNVHKVKYILAHACTVLKAAVKTGEISINRAEKWSHEPEAEQRENLRLYRITDGIRKKVRNLVAAHVALLRPLRPEQQVIRLTDLLKLIHQLSVIVPGQMNELDSIEVKLAKDCGRAVFVPEDLFSELTLQRSAPSR